jgi:hypothetical protein
MPMTEAERMVNAGLEIELKCLATEENPKGATRVRELTLEHVLTLASDLAVVLEHVQISDLQTAAAKGEDTDQEEDPKAKGKAGLEWLAKVLQQPHTLGALRKIAAATTGAKPAQFEEAGITDWVRWAAAMRKVVDWEELQELFTGLLPGPWATLTQAVRQKQSQT